MSLKRSQGSEQQELVVAHALSVSVKDLREDQSLTQAELAARAGVTVETIARLERVVRDRSSANSNPSLNTLVRIATALQCDIGQLLGIDTNAKLHAAGAHASWRNMEADRLEQEAARLRRVPRGRR